MSIPKKTKHRYYHLVKYEGPARGNQKITWGKWGLQAQQGAELTEKQLEATRKVVSGYTKKYADGKNKPWKFNIYPHFPKTKKPLEVRMGSGKGSTENWVAPTRQKTIILELSDKVPQDIAYSALIQAGHKLPGKYKVVEK
ncbi:50S ribosomal protein L16 [endosymbiont DhMRE of Dentiscutata heterogama]|uniref:50S ribosomal protein L16 n=1 Tax=endosymbiont DhMRE of Dentiscutata heterogama TaxID=1609546 RepID=UPI000629D926|nr:50S ribosomal protein L16 [endosymbiont DhMRE of Dentiscutata heterogama]CFW93101.1 50S ribosomal protein L16 [endosymbiont DhMRE of Dentiscutata heterogama]